jgi:2-(1,2-epoxy-1,2-dihydrophenyl)acetyl-CoA isomerase
VPPTFSHLDVSIDGPVGSVVLARPDALNALDPELLEELAVAFSWFADRAPARALIVSGAGSAFSVGGDLRWFQAGLESPDRDMAADVREAAAVLHRAIVDLARIGYPVIAAINGPAAGAGLSLALACDVRIASDKAVLAPSYGRIGASPDGGMTYFLPRVVGPSRALALLFDDPRLDAEQALAERLVSEVVPAGRLADRVAELARRMAAHSAHYVRVTKSLCAQSLANTLPEQLELERHGIADSMDTDAVRIGISAMLAGEVPDFHRP